MEFRVYKWYKGNNFPPVEIETKWNLEEEDETDERMRMVVEIETKWNLEFKCK